MKKSEHQTKVKIPIAKAYRLINYGPVVLVTSAWKDKQNVATIAWCSPLASEPVLAGVAVYQEHFTRKLIHQSKEFVINVPGADLRRKVENCGSVHGSQVDKFEKFGLTPILASKVKAPLVAECFAHLECKLVNEVKVGDHVLFVGEVVNALVDKGAVNKEGIVNLKQVKTLHHLGSDEFGTLEKLKS